jgi:hypothetical protein
LISSVNQLEATGLGDSSNNPLETSRVADTSSPDQPLLNNWQKLEIDNALDFLCLFDPNINEHKMTLHKWQAETLLELSEGKASSKHAFKYCLCAANGSGKDAFIVAPWALYFICCKIRSLVIITSSSGSQLTSQTESYIASLAINVNNYAIAIFGQPILKIRQRHITCLLSGSEIRLFATDEEGKAEGFHPKDFDSEFCVIVNEAKSVAPEIFRALRRCTGFSHWLNVSTPGQPQGDFYDSFELWPNKRRVTYFDCPHQSPEEFEYDKRTLGEHDPWFRSKWLAEFSFTGGKYVISSERLATLRKLNLFDKIRWIKKDAPIRIGIDIALSTAGDESVISAFRGNKQIAQTFHRIKDATLLADALEQDLNRLRVPRDSEHIYMDDGGVGRALIFMMRRKGWNVKQVRNNSPSKNKKQFRNRGAELWHKFSRLVEEGAIILIDDDLLYSQLSARKFKETDAGIDRLQLESKETAIARGMKSPDRADAAVLAWTGEPLDSYLDEIAQQPEIPEVDNRTDEEKLSDLEEKVFGDAFKVRKNKRVFASLNVLLGQNRKKISSRWL